ncbi:MAG: GerMN domain-containing protein [Candidatus Acidiferrum sp.]|jgi:sporulation and spore germination protein
MTPRWRVWLIGMLAIAVIIAGIYFKTLKKRLRQATQVPTVSEEQVRRELTQAAPATASGPLTKAKLFWSSGAGDGSLMPVTVELPLSNDPTLRAKQVLNTLLAGPVDAELRTLPPDAVLLALYMLPDGTAIADFSEAMATAIPSGIESEQMAVDSISKTLEANVPQVRWLKILIHGQEVDTLAGHLDLTRTFLVNAKASPMMAVAAPASDSAKPTAAGDAAASGKAGATSLGQQKPSATSQKLTPATPTGKLTQPVKKP